MNFQIINAVWGGRYLDTFLQLSLPTQFSLGNLKELKSKPDYVLYTDQAGKERICQASIYRRLQEHTNVIFRLIDIDQKKCPFDTLLECHSDAIKEGNKLRAPIIFLSPDCVLSTYIFSYLEKAVEQEKRLVVVCSARMSLEKYKEIVHKEEGSSFDEEVHWTSQDLAKTTINNLHYRGKCLLMGGKKISSHPSQMYWRLDKNNLLAKSFHLHPLLIWPEVHNVYPTLSADGKDFLEKICPTKSKWKAIQDCSEVSLFEISSNEQFTSDLQIPISSFWFKKWVSENTSEAHLHFLKYNIILGDSIRKPHWNQTIFEANKFIKDFLKARPLEKRNLRKLEKYKGKISAKRLYFKMIYRLIDYYQLSLFARMDRNFFKWHLILAYYVLTGKKKLTWGKAKNHFSYLFKYKNFPIHTLALHTNKARQGKAQTKVSMKKIFDAMRRLIIRNGKGKHMSKLDEKRAWNATTELLVKENYKFGPHWSFNFRNDPKRLGFVLSRYKFSSKMLGKPSHVLELGCSDGIGASILAENAQGYTGIDLDEPAIKVAKANFKDHTFVYDDFMGNTYGIFDGVVSLDVVEHILPEYEDLYFETLTKNLSSRGIAVIGTPNITASSYASKASELGHVNLFSQERLVTKLKELFHNVFSFGINDEIVHTGFSPMVHYLICVACHKKQKASL